MKAPLSAAGEPDIEVLSEQRSGYPRATPLGWDNVLFHLVGAAALLGLLAWASWWMARAVLELGLAASLLALGLGTVAGLFVADLLSGVAHWAFDTWFDEHHPVFHRMVLVVREHHIAPQEMFRYPFYNDTGQLSVIALLLTAPILLPVTLWAPASVPAVAGVWACVLYAVCFVFMLEFHKSGHRRPVHGVTRVLQGCHLLLSPRHHWQHHSGAYDTHYCLINGWADHLMDAMGGWRTLERVIQRWTGAVPRSNDDVWLETWLPPRRRALWSEARGDKSDVGRVTSTRKESP